MKFMDMVIDETLRMYPIGVRLDRVASCDYKYKDMQINKNDIIAIPVWTLHHDSELYPEPDLFNPFRFDEQSKKSRDKCAYLPFGNGPRNCIAMRFALLEIKLLLAKIFSKYKFHKTEMTQVKFNLLNLLVIENEFKEFLFGIKVPLVLQKFQMKPEKPIIVKIEKRH